jgi:hypothetical protein
MTSEDAELPEDGTLTVFYWWDDEPDPEDTAWWSWWADDDWEGPSGPGDL